MTDDKYSVEDLHEAVEIDELIEQHNDLGNSAFFSKRARGKLLYNYVARSWYAFDGKHWHADNDGSAVRFAKDMIREMQRLAAAIRDDEKRRKAMRHAINSGSRRRIEGMLVVAQPDLPVTPGEFNTDPLLFNVQNGTLDLRTRKLRPHDAADLISKFAPVTYDADATCPTWERFIAEIMCGRKALVDYLQTFVGLCLTGVTIDHMLAILYGTGANGKTTLLEVLATLFGSYGAVVDPAIFIAAHDNKGPSPELVRLHSARLVSASELPEGGRLSESVVKRLTGGDAIAARDLYSGIVEFEPTWKIAIATNHRPIVRDTSEGFWRRVHLVPFENVFTGDQRDQRLREKLLAELPGILNWALAGCERWQREGIERPAEVAAATSTYRSESDLVGAFIGDRCVVVEQAQARGTALYTAFTTWAKQGGERAATSRTFLAELRARGFESRRSNSDNVFTGIGIRDEHHDQGDIA